MEKASTVLRRSGVRLRTSFGSVPSTHADLQMIVAQLKDAKGHARALSMSESAAWQDITKWSLKEDNRAIQDALCQVGELANLWTEVQKELSDGLRDFRHQFEMVLEGERGLVSAKAVLDNAQSKELKLRKEIKKAAKKTPRAELSELQDKHQTAERERDLAQIEVFDRSREHEVVKMIRMKDGLLKLSQAYMDMAQKCEMIFESASAIAQTIPDVEGSDIQDIKYTGSGTNMRTVLDTKDRLKRFQRQDRRVSQPRTHDLPPPYTENPPENPYFISPNDLSDSPRIDGATSASASCTMPPSLYPRLNQSLPSYDPGSTVPIQAQGTRRRSDHTFPARPCNRHDQDVRPRLDETTGLDADLGKLELN